MKICSKCRELKPEAEYFVRDKSTGRLHAHCKLCYKEHRKTYAAEHYQKYGDLYRVRARTRRANVKKRLRKKLSAYMEGRSCELCPESDIRALDFDHLDPKEKKFGIAKAIANGLKWEDILREIQKCRILCANCHRKHTATQQNWYRNILEEST